MRWGWCLAIAWCLGTPVAAKTWQVTAGDDLPLTIARATSGDTIEVAPGVYPVNLVIDKPLRLIGKGKPTLSGGEQGDVIRVKSPDVMIEGFIVRDSGNDLGAQHAGIYLERGSHRAVVRGCDFAWTLFGLWIEKADDVLIENNRITGKRDYASAQRGNGIQLYNSQRARIIGNDISFVRDGIYVDVSHQALFRGNRMHHARYGTHYMNSHQNVWEDNEVFLNRGGLALMEVREQIVRRNKAWGNTDHGIMLRTIQDAVIEDNVVAGNARGFFIYDAEYNTLKNNLVIGNRVGVHLWAGSYRNAVDGNDFIGNREPIRYVATRDEIWGKTAGNYWSNYLGWDHDGDGRGDVQYEANDVVDRLVWRHPLAKLLIHSAAVQTLRMVSRQFPILRVPSIVDPHPAMQPHHANWSEWLEPNHH
ncbi:nitrous oxidase accessory protein [Chitinivorax tropicus]|uniref:Nitrous oxidase accessory protein n=1 Tax=Chitinivorax tropicus TaxID=714531 RepID=A0A840MIL2_9PROT|nr:nitrous oxide reductase family maturation protein NosD [Chitinivorax tropicus]MBB5018488.1 nitrous oxidase accessory protein [Chitinivorax tropicus]